MATPPDGYTADVCGDGTMVAVLHAVPPFDCEGAVPIVPGTSGIQPHEEYAKCMQEFLQLR